MDTNPTPAQPVTDDQKPAEDPEDLFWRRFEGDQA
jgi:hypothetical protein